MNAFVRGISVPEFIFWLLLPATISFSGLVLASEETLGLAVGVGGFYDSNRELNIGFDQETSGSHQSITGWSETNTKRSQLKSGFTITAEQVPGSRELENDTAKLDFSGLWRTLKSEFEFGLAVNKDTTLATEVQASTTVDAKLDRYRGTINTGYRYHFSPVFSTSVQLYGEKTDYKNSENTGLSEYTYYEGSVGVSRSLSENSSTDLSVSTSEVVPDSSQYTNNTTGITTSYSRTLSEIVDFSASIGIRETIYKYDLPYAPYFYEEKYRSRVSSIQFSLKGKWIDSSFSGSYNVRPNGSGDLVAQELATASMHLKWSRLQNTILRIAYNSQASDLESKADEDLESLLFSAVHTWKIYPSFDMAVRYRGFWRKKAIDEHTAHSDYVSIDLTWKDSSFGI